MGMAERSGNGFVLWQIESNGSWNWEISTIAGRLYLLLNGPSAGENDWSVTLRPGEKFESVKCALAYAATRDGAFAEMTSYRRKIRRINEDNEKLPVIFNDYMNCLFGDPTTEKEIPLIDRAAELGIEYYCIDCGWYDDGDWWTTVGEWKPAQTRFRGGLKKLTDYIRSKGMVPGLWLEIEVMGIESELAKRLPDSWFFMRGGRRVIDHGRYQLDFSVPEVRAYADGVVDRLVSEYGVGYIKNDYNINCGKGSNQYCGSCGDGLLKHNRGFVSWLEGVYRRHPHLVIENCASGGFRLEPGMFSLSSMSSFSDAHELETIPVIAASLHRLMPARQMQIWAVMRSEASLRHIGYLLSAAMLGRLCLSGDILKLSAEQFDLVAEATRFYRQLVPVLRDGDSRVVQEIGPSRRHLTGGQSVVRLRRDGAQAAVWCHAFNEPPRELIAGLPDGKWRLETVFGVPDWEGVQVADGGVHWLAPAPMSGMVALLTRE